MQKKSLRRDHVQPGLLSPFIITGILVGLCGGCRQTPQPINASDHSATSSIAPTSAKTNFHFVNVDESAGLKFTHSNGTKRPLTTLDTTGSGLAWIDYDRDGWPDLFCVGGSPEHKPGTRRPQNRLFRNNGNGKFTDVTARAGVAAIGHYGMGVAVGDYDGDGYDDLYLTCYGPNILYRNNGNGTFTDVTAKARVSAGATSLGALKMSTSAAWFDADGDGWLDLYVCNYLAFSDKSLHLCRFKNVMSACPPHQYPAQPDHFFHNRGDGTFEDWSQRAGFRQREPGRAMGVLPFDADNDGRQDVFVANDGTSNFFFRNLGGGKFEEVGFKSGVAVSETASEMANMGVDIGDYDATGKLSIIVTHFQSESNTLFQPRAPFDYIDDTTPRGLGTSTWNYLGFGCGFFDADLDGKLEIVFINGHVQDNIDQIEPSVTWAQTAQLFQFQNGRFHDVSVHSGPAFQERIVGRGSAFADYDGDGDVDIAVSTNGSKVQLWRNESQHGHFIQVRLQGLPPNRAALGAQLRVTAGGRTQTAQLISGRSYLADSERRMTFGLGAATQVTELTVKWPNGREQVLTNLPADQCVTIRQTR